MDKLTEVASPYNRLAKEVIELKESNVHLLTLLNVACNGIDDVNAGIKKEIEAQEKHRKLCRNIKALTMLFTALVGIGVHLGVVEMGEEGELIINLLGYL